jgi:hypothetical protein
MSDVISGDPDADWDDFTIPTDDDEEDASSVDVAFETLADRSAYLKALRHEVTTVTRSVESTPEFVPGQWSSYLVPAATSPTNAAGWLQKSTVSAVNIFFPFRPPHGSVIKQIDVTIQPYTSHGGVVGTKPTWSLISINKATGLDTGIVTQADLSGSLGAYETRHAITRAFMNTAIDRVTNRYVIKFSGETGANAHIDLCLIGISFNFSMTHLDEAPGT